MHYSFSATALAAFSAISLVSAGPIAARQVCGTASTGTVAQTPLSQPAGITTAANCAIQCKANPKCLSFLFGLVNGINECKLYSVPASLLPPSSGLVTYDIGCTSIPSVVPTASNPGGLAPRQAPKGQVGSTKAQGSTQVGTHASPANAVPAGSPAPIAKPAVKNLAACLAKCKGNPSCIAYTFENGVCKLFGATVARRQRAGTHASPVNSLPAGNPAPLAKPAVKSLAACLTACKGNPSCVAYTFESGVCKLFGATVGRRQQKGAQGATAGNAAKNPSTPTTTTPVGTHANPQNAIPAGAPAPIATPKVDNLAACLAACKTNSACIAYTFLSGVCKLFN